MFSTEVSRECSERQVRVLEMREKRAAFPRHVKALITICVHLIHRPDVAAPVVVVCLDTSTIWFSLKPG